MADVRRGKKSSTVVRGEAGRTWLRAGGLWQDRESSKAEASVDQGQSSKHLHIPQGCVTFKTKFGSYLKTYRSGFSRHTDGFRLSTPLYHIKIWKTGFGGR